MVIWLQRDVYIVERNGVKYNYYWINVLSVLNIY
jgi:hypothetical protein